MEMEVLIKDSYMASLLHSLRPRSEKMMGEKEGGDGEISRGGEVVLNAHVGSFTTGVEEVMNGVLKRPRSCFDNS